MKIVTSNDNINSFGGLNYISNEFDKLQLSEIITFHLGTRSNLATYEYHDIIKNMWMLLFAGGDCAEDIHTNLKSELLNVINLNVCSADTILRLQQSLSLGKEIHLSKKGTVNEFSKHEVLNRLNIDLLINTKQLNTKQGYTLDFDNQLITCQKYDSKKSYKMVRGYFPGVATIGKNIVWLENRNGNSNVKFKQEETLEQTFKGLEEAGVRIAKSRMDCGSFTQKVITVVEKNSEKFYIRAQRCGELTTKIHSDLVWIKTTVGVKDVELTSVEYQPFKGEKSYRYVVSREANKTNQMDIFQQDTFIYRAIITNDREISDAEVVEFYNQRGASEKIFDEMNNDFGWGNLPFSFLDQNTVFMLLTAMCRNFYLYILDKISKKVPFVENTFRLKKFIFRFVVVPFKWIKKGGQKTLKLFTSKPYHLVLE